MQGGVSLDDYISRVASLVSIPNLEFLHTIHETDILALTLMKQFRITFVFDAYHAATCLSTVADKTIISTDEVYESRRVGETRPAKHLSTPFSSPLVDANFPWLANFPYK